MKRFICVLYLSIGLFPAYTQTITADSIFNNFYAATGGKAKWDSVETFLIRQQYRSGSANDFDLEVRGSIPLQGLLRIRTIMRRDFIQGIRANDGWLKVPIGSRDKVTQFQTSDLSNNERENMRRELRDLLPFANYTQKGYIATVVGTENINNRPAHHVELSGQGIRYNLFFDTQSGLLVRERVTLPTNEVQTRDHTKYDTTKYGLSYPSEGTFVSSIDRRTVRVATTADFNVKLPDDSFVR
ncbi:MAG: hypothetical protein ACK4GN_08450 [Runella sp.]